MSKIKKSFYDDFKENKTKKSKISQTNVKSEHENIIIEEKNKIIVKILSFLSFLFSSSIKVFFAIIFSILISIALTVIFNSNIRNYILELLK